jgi:DNA-binding IclR family transcriptional regulator
MKFFGVSTVATSEVEQRSITSSGAAWTFLTNHAHVLVCIAQYPETRLRDVADQVAITERAVQRIVADLEEAGVLTRLRDGRRNRYQINRNVALRHPVEAHRTVNDLLEMVRVQNDD